MTSLTIRPRRGRHILRPARPLLSSRVERFPWGVLAAWTSVIVGAFVVVVNVLRAVAF